MTRREIIERLENIRASIPLKEGSAYGAILLRDKLKELICEIKSNRSSETRNQKPQDGDRL